MRLIDADALKHEFIRITYVRQQATMDDSVKYPEFTEVDIEKVIDYMPTIGNKDEIVDYLKLSLKQADENKEKYRQAYKQSNSEHDLYCSNLFEGMGEAYADILEKFGEKSYGDNE